MLSSRSILTKEAVHKLWQSLNFPRLAFALSFALAIGNTTANTIEPQNELEALSENIQNLKQEVVTLNKDLRALEEKLLFPSSSKYTFFLTVERGKFFSVESIKIKLNGTQVTSHLYDDISRQALSRGGVQKLYTTNLSEGEHTVIVFFTGLGPNNTPFKRASEVTLNKRSGEGYMEISIQDNGDIQEPEFLLKQW